MASRVDGALQVSGALTANSISLQTGTISADRIGRRVAATYWQASGASVATETQVVYVANAAGSLVNVDVFVDTAPTGGDRAYTVDVKKSTGAGAFATVLSAVETINSSDSNRTVYTPTINSASYSGADAFEVVITTSGSTGTQGLGVCVTLTFDENPS